MGLGLAICKALVTAQNGMIAVESGGRDQGTTFTINFSAYTDPGGTSLI
jgi:signal transduction histidine kinase